MRKDLNPSRRAQILTRRWRTAFFAALLGGLLLTYHQALFLPLGSDARFLTYDNSFVRDRAGFGSPWTSDFFGGAVIGSGLRYLSGYYRPVTNTFFWLEYRIAGRRDFVYNFDQLLLHWLCACLVYSLVWRIAASELTAVVAALLFAFHPINAFAATQVKARGDPLFLSFYLLAMLAYWATQFPRSTGWKKWGVLALSVLLYALSLLSKEMGATLPLALCLLHLFWWYDRGIPLSRALATLPFWLTAAGYLVWRLGVLGIWPAKVGYLAANSAMVVYLNLLKNVSIYLLRILLPNGADYPEIFPTLVNSIDPTMTDPNIYLSALLLVILASAAVGLRRKSPGLAFGMALFLATLTPLASVESIAGAISVQRIPAQERFVYLPAIGVFLMLAMAAATMVRRTQSVRGRLVLAGGATILLVSLARMAAIHAVSSETWLAMLKQYYLLPEDQLSRLDRANKLILYAQLVAIPLGDLAEAESRAQEAVALVPDSPMPAVGLANVLAAAGKWPRVVTTLQPWLTPSLEQVRELQRTNFRAADDINRTTGYVAYLLGIALGQTDHGKESLDTLCLALRRNYDERIIAAAVAQIYALDGAPRCIDSPDPKDCLAKTAPPDFPEWKLPLDPNGCPSWSPRLQGKS